MARSARLRLHDMIESIEVIEDMTRDLEFEDYRRSLPIRFATERAVEIISEASRALPAALKGQHPHIRWADIAGIGNILRHEYQRVDPLVMWRTIRDELPGLKAALTALLAASR